MKTLRNLIVIAVIVLLAIAAFIYLNPTQSSNIGYFNGHTYFSLNNSVSGNFTAAAWVYYSSFNGTGVVISQGLGENQHSIWYMGTGGEILNKTLCGVFSDQRIGNFTAGWRFAMMPFVGTGRWNQIVCVYNTSYVSVYLNGVLMNRTQAPYAVSAGNIIEVGKRTSTFYLNGTTPTFAFFHGYMTNIQVYNAALNSSSIFRLYSSGMNSLPLNSRVIFLPFRNSTGLSDCSVFDVHCTLTRHD